MRRGRRALGELSGSAGRLAVMAGPVDALPVEDAGWRLAERTQTAETMIVGHLAAAAEGIADTRRRKIVSQNSPESLRKGPPGGCTVPRQPLLTCLFTCRDDRI